MFLLAIVSSIRGGLLIQRVLDNPRGIEAGLCVAAAFIPVTLLSAAGAASPERHSPPVELLIMSRATILEHGVPIFLGLGSIILYFLLFRTGLVPRYIAIWGSIAAPAVIIANTVLAGTTVAPVLVVPILLNEIYLGIYLLAKGFRANATVAPHGVLA